MDFSSRNVCMYVIERNFWGKKSCFVSIYIFSVIEIFFGTLIAEKKEIPFFFQVVHTMEVLHWIFTCVVMQLTSLGTDNWKMRSDYSHTNTRISFLHILYTQQCSNACTVQQSLLDCEWKFFSGWMCTFSHFLTFAIVILPLLESLTTEIRLYFHSFSTLALACFHLWTV